MIDFTIALLSSLSSPPGLLVALALAPRLTGRTVILLAVVDLWLLLEVLESLARPAYLFGSHAVPRLMASALHIGLAIAVFRTWQRIRSAEEPARPVPLRRSPLPGRRPLRPAAGSRLSEAA